MYLLFGMNLSPEDHVIWYALRLFPSIDCFRPISLSRPHSIKGILLINDYYSTAGYLPTTEGFTNRFRVYREKEEGEGEGDKMREEWVGERGGGVGEETEGRNERRENVSKEKKGRSKMN